MVRRLVVVTVLALVGAAPLHGQLRDRINQLFIFGPGEAPLFLAGTADPNNPASIRVHGTHFVPAAAAGNGTVISFITSAVGANVANVPFSAASGGTTFRFEGGVPVQTSTSSGPIFGERAQTLGRGRMMAGATWNRFRFRTLRGQDLHNLQLIFTHANVTGPECDSIVGGDCTPMGVPTLENDIMLFRLSLDVEVSVAAFYLTYGVSDRLDVGISLPVLSTSLQGTSEAQLVPFGGPTAAHFFAGTPTAPVLSASRSVQGSASGLGDVAVRAKWAAGHNERLGVSFLVDLRFPTGSEADLLGSGSFTARALGVVSGRSGSVAPHVNVGYLHRGSELLTDAVLATVGFDHLLAPWATLAMDLVTELQVGESPLRVPDEVVIEVPFRRTVRATTIQNSRDDIVNGSVGVKLRTREGVMVVLNTLWPLNRGGLRPNLLWTAGVEYNF
jgi:hypothetical protein